jgi:response regulator RpfG family c-di-GMP phosphodiesterase
VKEIVMNETYAAMKGCMLKLDEATSALEYLFNSLYDTGKIFYSDDIIELKGVVNVEEYEKIKALVKKRVDVLD